MTLFLKPLKALSAAILMAGAACSQPVSEGAGATGTSWSINPGGDLNAFFDCLEDQGATLVSAHRGGPHKGYPENALETMEALLAEAPAIMEVDVATSADGVLFLLHDDTLERTTTGSGEASDYRWAEIEALRLKDESGAVTPFHPVRLDDALRWAAGRTILQLDIKRSTRYADIARTLNDQHAEDRVVLIANTLAQAEILHRLMPETMISLTLNSQSDLNRAVAAGVPDNSLLGFTGVETPRPRLYSVLNNRKVEVIFGTLGGRSSIDAEIARSGEENRYADLAADGVDVIATDRPKAAFAALQAAGRTSKAGLCGVNKH